MIVLITIQIIVIFIPIYLFVGLRKAYKVLNKEPLGYFSPSEKAYYDKLEKEAKENERLIN